MDKNELFKKITFPWIFKQIPNALYIDDGNESRKYVPERTCTVESGYDLSPLDSIRWTLSCGDIVEWASEDPPEYCPWCGAKVIDRG